MIATLALALALALALSVTPTAEAPCQDPARPIHYMPYCLTPAEYQAIIAPQVAPGTPQQPSGPTSSPATGVEAWRSLVARYWPAWHVETALRIIRCESGGDPNARNRYSGASGLFQHIPRYWAARAASAGWAGASIFNPEANIAVSAWLWNGGRGASHWSASARCW